MEYEEIEEDEINTAISLVNDDWYKAKEKNRENKPILKIFKKKDDGVLPSKDNGDKISIKQDENKNSKIIYKLSITGEPFLPFTSNKLFKILNILKPKWDESLNNSVNLKILNTKIPFLFDKIEN